MAGELPYAAPIRTGVQENDPVLSFFRKHIVQPMMKGYGQPGGSGTGVNFGVQRNANQGQPAIRPTPQAAAPGGPGNFAPAGPTTSPTPHPASGGNFGEGASPGNFAAPKPAAQATPNIGMSRPPAVAYHSPAMAQAQNDGVPKSPAHEPVGQINYHDIHPMIRQLMQTPGSFQQPQYKSMTFDRVPGMDYDPYPSLSYVPGMPRSLPATQMYGPAPVGPSGPSHAENVFGALGLNSKMQEANAQSQMYGGMAAHYQDQAQDPLGLKHYMTPEEAKSVITSKAGAPMGSPFSGMPILQGIMANPAANIGMIRKGFEAENLMPGDPRAIETWRKIQAMREGWDTESLMQENAGGRSPLNGIEFGNGALPWFPNFKHYQSPESLANQQWLRSMEGR